MKKYIAFIIYAVFAVSCFTASNVGSSVQASTQAAENTSHSQGETTTAVTAQTTVTTTVSATVTDTKQTAAASAPANQSRVVLPVKNVQQLPELPTGCEITSATIALNYYGFNVTKMQMLEYLPMVAEPDRNGVWVSPNEAFLGDPRLETSYGCYSGALTKAIETYFKANSITGYTVEDADVKSFEELYEYIDKGDPVIIWASIEMQDIERVETVWRTRDKQRLYWLANEHCLVLIGYDKDKDTVILSDPLDPKGTVEYSRAVVEKAYQQMQKQSLVIHKQK